MCLRIWIWIAFNFFNFDLHARERVLQIWQGSSIWIFHISIRISNFEIRFVCLYAPTCSLSWPRSLATTTRVSHVWPVEISHKIKIQDDENPFKVHVKPQGNLLNNSLPKSRGSSFLLSKVLRLQWNGSVLWEGSLWKLRCDTSRRIWHAFVLFYTKIFCNKTFTKLPPFFTEKVTWSRNKTDIMYIPHSPTS